MSIIFRDTEWFEVGEKEPPAMVKLVVLSDWLKKDGLIETDPEKLVIGYRTYWDGERWGYDDAHFGLLPCPCQDVVYWSMPGEWIGKSMVKPELPVCELADHESPIPELSTPELSEEDSEWWEFDPDELVRDSEKWNSEQWKEFVKDSE